jgi:hypothetical protein
MHYRTKLRTGSITPLQQTEMTVAEELASFVVRASCGDLSEQARLQLKIRVLQALISCGLDVRGLYPSDHFALSFWIKSRAFLLSALSLLMAASICV